MPHRPTLIAAFALTCMSALPASAAADPDACRIVAPRYEPKAHASETQPSRWLGGARMHRPVAEPCPQVRRPADV